MPLSDCTHTVQRASLLGAVFGEMPHSDILDKRFKLAVLVFAGIELIFFVVASMGLCFGFVLETVLIIQGCFSYC